ncbi:MAG: hypothetical protein WBF26_11595, partial [Candidatus Sulfotelmatobacter sp.]
FGVEVIEKGVVVVEALGHGFFRIGMERTVIKSLRSAIPRPWGCGFDVIFESLGLIVYADKLS